jgi:two-component system sensor histidine kinase KdpD
MSKSERDFDRRPDPDALLALAGAEKRGKLKVFLGAAPGVGKTYAMLQNARRLRDDGTDVLIGIVETHGRAETMALLDGLEILPRRRAPHQGRMYEEFDLDAALARKPELIVVDELAHTNAGDSRHPKRWQDVEELLDAGINVWTALNIQHLESLADVVSSITGVKVRETIPDTVLQTAQDVVLVDITPEELIQRLRDGKVYLPETARRATTNFFTPGNLTALRELALRRTADRVDDQMVDFLRRNAIEGPWRTTERLMALVGADEASDVVVRTASRLATGLNATWVAVHVAPDGYDGRDATGARRLADVMALAERLGGEVATLSGADIVGEALRFARRENITQVIIGRSSAGRLARLLGRSMSDAIVRQSSDIGVHVISGDDKPRGPGASRWFRSPPTPRIAGILLAAGAVGAAVAVGHFLNLWLRLPNLSMIFLTAVLFCAVTRGVSSAVVASILSFFAYNFFFIEPIYTLTIAEPHELFALLIFLAVAILTGSLAGRVRDQSAIVRRRADETQSLYDFSRRLAGANDLDSVLWAASAHLHRAMAARVVLLLPEDGELAIRAAWPPEDQLDIGETTAATWAFEKAEPSGWGTGTLPNLRYQFRPLLTTRGVLGVCGVSPETRDVPFSADAERALAGILEQTALTIDRAILAREAVKTSAMEENEKLRTTLLASLSHDLRTPLASIIGAVSTLRQLGDKMPADSRQDLLASIEEEAGRLSRFVANLLDMSRIESGALNVRRDWVDVSDVVRSAVERARKLLPGSAPTISIAASLPFVRGDAHLLEQVLFNLLDNAGKYARSAPAMVHARKDGGDVLITVTDEGPGIKPADLEKVFEKFYRGGRADGRQAGTGLGLSISRGIIEAMGGTITAQSPAIRRRGTRMVIRLPAADAPPQREMPA